MNLGLLRDRVGYIVNQAAGTEKARADRTASINEELRQVLGAREWPFAKRMFEFKALPDIEFSFSDWTANDKRSIRFSDARNWDDIIDRPNLPWTMGLLQGATIQPPSTVYAGLEVDGYGVERFTIESAGIVAPGNVLELKLDPRFSLPGGKTSDYTGDWKIRAEHYVCPRDLGSIHSVTWAQDGVSPRRALQAWTPEDEAFRGTLNPDTVGVPASWQIETQGRTLAFSSTTQAYNEPRTNQHVTGDPVRAPVREITLTPATGTGTLPLLQRISYCYTWLYAGRESSPSPIAQVTLSGTENQVALSTLEVLDDNTYGRTRVIYRRVNEGRWQRIGSITDPSSGIFTDLGTFNPTSVATAPLTDYRLFDSSPPKLLRLWPRPDAFYPITVRYTALPAPLVSDQDEPELLPYEYHDILVHLVAAKELSALNQADLVKVQLAFAADRMSQMAAKYLTDVHTAFVRGMGGGGGYNFQAPRWLG